MDYGVLLNYFSVNQRGELTDLHCSGEIAIDEYRALEVYTSDIFLNIYFSLCFPDPGNHLHPLHCVVHHCLVSEHTSRAAGHR